MIGQEVERIYIPSVDGLDSIILYLEQWRKSGKPDFNQGSITAVCYGEAWNFLAGNFGDRSIREFIAGCDEFYLGNKFAYGINEYVTDYDAISKKLGFEVSSEYEVGLCSKQISEAFGPDFAYDLPQTENHKFQYVVKVAKRIIDHLNSENKSEAA
jgi:hypothetical protein